MKILRAPASMSPDVVEARRLVENLERQIVFGAVNSYRFYQSIRGTVCPYLTEHARHRQDFATERFNTLWKFIAAFYQRFENKTISADFALPNSVLAAYVIDSANIQGIPEDIATQMCEEIKVETDLTKSLTLESLTALAQSDAFSDWFKKRILQQTAGTIESQKHQGLLTLEKLEEIVAQAQQQLNALKRTGQEITRQLGEFKTPAENDANELIGPNRFLCRGGIATLIGQSGIGKSTLALQMGCSFTLGRESVGFKPVKPLKVLVIQGENDDGDIAEMRDGVAKGINLTDEEKAVVFASVHCLRCNTASGRKFIEGPVRQNLAKYQPDIIIIDPALSYIGGDTKEQKVVGEFLRTFLLPELQRANCGCLLLHHTNKPPTTTPRGGAPSEESYLESGSAEFRNVARGVITLRPIGDGTVFELRVPKRGNRLGWTDDSGQPTTKKHLRHSRERNVLFWETATEDDAKASMATAQEQNAENIDDKVLAYITQQGEVSQAALWAEMKKLGVGEKKCRDAIKRLLAESKILCPEKPRPGVRGEKFYSTNLKPSIPGGETR